MLLVEAILVVENCKWQATFIYQKQIWKESVLRSLKCWKEAIGSKFCYEQQVLPCFQIYSMNILFLKVELTAV